MNGQIRKDHRQGVRANATGSERLLTRQGKFRTQEVFHKI